MIGLDILASHYVAEFAPEEYIGSWEGTVVTSGGTLLLPPAAAVGQMLYILSVAQATGPNPGDAVYWVPPSSAFMRLAKDTNGASGDSYQIHAKRLTSGDIATGSLPRNYDRGAGQAGSIILMAVPAGSDVPFYDHGLKGLTGSGPITSNSVDPAYDGTLIGLASAVAPSSTPDLPSPWTHRIKKVATNAKSAAGTIDASASTAATSLATGWGTTGTLGWSAGVLFLRDTPPSWEIFDNFQRADGAMGVVPIGGGTWFNIVNSMTISNGTVGGADARAAVETGHSDGVFDSEFAVYSDGAGLIFRCVDANNYLIYAANVSGNHDIYSVIGGAGALLNRVSHVPATGDKIRLILNGTSIKLYINGVLKNDFTSSVHQTATKHGFFTPGGSRFARFYVHAND